jgi:hypothetical protein
MSESPLAPELTTAYDSPLGAVELTSSVTFGVREAVLAGVAVSPSAAAGQGGVFADVAGLVWTTHITCSITAKTSDE